MKKLTLALATLGLVLSVGLTGCGNDKDKAETTEASKTTTILPTKDRSGAEIDLPEKVTKIVSLAPSTTQVINDLGRKDDLIGVDSQSPLSTEGLDELPQFDMMSVDAEKLIALKPEVVYVTDINFQASESVWTQLKEAGIQVINIPTSTSVEAVALDVQFIADTLNEHEKGQKLVDTMEQEIATVKEIGSKITDKKKVLFEISALPDIYSFGSGVFLNELLDILGAQNVLADENGWLPVTEEAAIASKPDGILTYINYMEDPGGDILDRETWQTVPAIKDKAVYLIDNTSSSLPNNHITKALKEMAKAIYPDEYQDLMNE